MIILFISYISGMLTAS